MTQNSELRTQNSCSYCGLPFAGRGYSPGGERSYCCRGCYLVEQIAGARGEEGIAAWILIRLGVGAFLAMNVMMIAVVLYAQSAAEIGASAVNGLRWAMLILSTPAMIILGGPFAVGAIRDLRRLRLSADALIVTGSLAAFLVSAAHVVRGPGEVYFDTATMLLLIVTFGRLLEAAARVRTSRAIQEMIDLTPDTARVARDGREEEIPCDEVVPGDMMVVKPGERIPVDGRIVSGRCLVEESAFTGEARPRACGPGEEVFGGSVSCDGLLTVEATAAKSDSLLARIQDAVRQAQRNRAPVELLMERVSSVFIPVVWAASAAAWLYWGAARGDMEKAGLSALAVLVVACPCALGIATSVAACLAIGKAARAGVLIRSGEILERLPKIRQVFFDKTGTLTENRMSVSRISAAGVPENEALAWAASVEMGSGHVIANAIVEAARAQGIRLGDVSELRVFPGMGVQGLVTLDGDAKLVTAGSVGLLAEEHRMPQMLLSTPDGLTTVYAGWDGEVRVAISLDDKVRPEARAAIEALRAEGIRTAVISGDREGPTVRLARELGVDDVLFERRPDQKAEAVRKARQALGGAAMVGDGINDAPALGEADVGIATGGGADLARQSSDVTLLGDDLSRIPWVLDLAKLTYGIIRQNLAWAFGYNCAAICLAFLGYVHPLIAAGAMVFSSLSVILNSMRLVR
ncbi:MAG: cation-translocating P-type ATPase [Armatimonadota bacterium]|nr:cation-translocating P-type ATPase [Armatimonadota bacterium]